MKLSIRITMVLGLMILLSTISSLSGLWQMSVMRSQADEVGKNWLPSVDLIHSINTNTSDFRISEFSHVVNTDSSKMARVEADMANLGKVIAETRQRYEPLISSPEERALYEDFGKEWAAYLALNQRLLELSRANQNEQARDLLSGESRQRFDAASADLLKLVDLNRNGALASVQVADAASGLARTVLVAMLATSLVGSVAAGFWLVRSVQSQLGGDPAAAAEAVNHLASGDLAQTIPIATSNPNSLMHRLAAMQKSLQSVVGNVRLNAESVATASAQIAQGNTDLSGRTEEQASALEQTSATMEQLNTTVRHNADNAKQANQLAQSASTVAVQGGEVVGQVVQTMKEINASSQKISEIIGVIDAIAFQTNILALNAAVEAARAGEQGRGFAVVAAEVRNLAQRSAEAAKEIKALIGRSVDQVEHGSALVDQAGQTMEAIVASIRRVTDIVGEISSASAEQSAGVQQVGEAVTQMDLATQQNAALVEESAAAANSLQAQADQLVKAVAAFKLA